MVNRGNLGENIENKKMKIKNLKLCEACIFSVGDTFYKNYSTL